MFETEAFPTKLHIITYDVRGRRIDTNEQKTTRETGIVTQTHQLMTGFVRRQPGLELVVTQTGAHDTSSFEIVTPEEHVVYVQGIESDFPALNNPATGNVDRARVHHFFETTINDPRNPVYKSLAEQYAAKVYEAGTPHLLVQNPNPLVGILKAEERGYLDDFPPETLNLTGVIHDIEGYGNRLRYIQNSYQKTATNLKLLAISTTVYSHLDTLGVPTEKMFYVPNGIDIERFDQSVAQAKEEGVFNLIQERNGLPKKKRMVLVSARRSRHKGHLDTIEAAAQLNAEGKLDDVYFAFTGAHMSNAKSVGYERELQNAVHERSLEDKVFLLDELRSIEVAACYGEATAAILASTEPEGFAYANIEAMLARTAVITTQIGGPLDYIEHGKTGMFVQPHNPRDIAQTLDAVLTNKSLYTTLMREGRKKAEQYSINNMIDGYAKAITEHQ